MSANKESPSEESLRDQQARLWLSPAQLDYHLRQFEQPYRSTVRLGEFVREVLPDVPGRCEALDVACGAGANMTYLAGVLPNALWMGVDIAEHLLDLGRAEVASRNLQGCISFQRADLFNLHQELQGRKFDLVFSIQTLSWLQGYEDAVRQLMQVGRRCVFLTSLFTDFLVDARIEVTQYESESDATGSGPHFYNIYALERFRHFCMRQGATRLSVADVEIDRELPLPDHRRMGTYTQRLADGRLQQCSGPLLLPWKMIAVHLD